MPIEVCTISGYTKTGGNSTAIKVDDEVVILDMGLAMENYIKFQEDREHLHTAPAYKQLLRVKAVPDYNHINDWKDKVVAIAPSHGHLDHIGAIPFAASLFPNAPVVATPYTIEILQSTLRDERMDLPNKLVAVPLNGKFKVSDKITLEFVNITHSIPHSSMIAVHTPYGIMLYCNDYKFDRTPTLGKKPNFKRLEELGNIGVVGAIVECLYADDHRKMPSEAVAKQMLEEVMLSGVGEGKAMIVTTFSSQIARLKSIVEMGKKLNRQIVFLGRSLGKYVSAAERLEIVDFSNDVKMFRHRDKIEKMLRKIEKQRDKYLIVCTGHQGEPRAILSRLMRKELDFNFVKEDVVIFSCSVIPVELNKGNRDKLEKGLRKFGVRIFRDVHVSGHGALEDHRDLLKLIKPKYLIPSHAGEEKGKHLIALGKQCDVKFPTLMLDGGRIILR